MAETLVGKSCTPCKGGIPPLTRRRPSAFTSRFQSGSCATRPARSSAISGSRTLARRCASCSKVGELAEAEGHHPDISFGWGYAIVSLQTKKIKGLHENDFIMAAKIDRLAEQAAR